MKYMFKEITFWKNSRLIDKYFILQKIEPFKYTKIKDDEGKVKMIDLPEWNFIPNGHFEEINELLGENNLCHIIKDCNYMTTKKTISKVRTKEFCYPCVYAVNLGETKFYWSSTDQNGHFGIPKVIYKVGNAIISDPKGDYGLTEWCAGIVCPPEEHQKVMEVYQSEKFKKLKKAFTVSQHSVNVKILRLFKDKWWNEF